MVVPILFRAERGEAGYFGVRSRDSYKKVPDDQSWPK
jgi:hypothetical protein